MKFPQAFLLAILLVFTPRVWAQAVSPQGAHYSLDFPNRAGHIAEVTFHPSRTAGDLRIQLPAWNALYQIRDFAQHILSLKAFDEAHRQVQVEKIDKSTWSVPNATEIHYQIYLDEPGPFGAQVNAEHVFLNLAQVLVYAVGQRSEPVEIVFPVNLSLVGPDGVSHGPLPNDQQLAVMLRGSGRPCAGRSCFSTFSAPNYDELVDAPVEIGKFQEASFDQDGIHFRIVIHADPADYKLDSVVGMVKKITAAEVDWMQDHPLKNYLFIYHLSKGPAAGGMEHANSTAIDLNAAAVAQDPDSLASVTAHEFFHLWNVKRIRPSTLEPIDFTGENFTRALWFAEGVDSTVSDSMMVRAGILDEKQFLRRLADQIETVQTRAAHRAQSVEESSLDTWLEKYPFYRQPERSLSYYVKGQVLGVLLDLAMRSATNGHKSLRDLFHWMNENFAKQGRFYDDSDAIRDAVEKICGHSFSDFFKSYVAGVDELPYDNLFRTVGLHVRRVLISAADPGFTASTNYGPKPVITAVDDGGEASKAGLRSGDVIEFIEGRLPARGFESQIAAMRAGSQLHLQISNARGTRDVRLQLTARQTEEYDLVDLDQVTTAQRSRRAAWIRGDSQ